MNSRLALARRRRRSRHQVSRDAAFFYVTYFVENASQSTNTGVVSSMSRSQYQVYFQLRVSRLFAQYYPHSLTFCDTVPLTNHRLTVLAASEVYYGFYSEILKMTTAARIVVT